MDISPYYISPYATARWYFEEKPRKKKSLTIDPLLKRLVDCVIEIIQNATQKGLIFENIRAISANVMQTLAAKFPRAIFFSWDRTHSVSFAQVRC